MRAGRAMVSLGIGILLRREHGYWSEISQLFYVTKVTMTLRGTQANISLDILLCVKQDSRNLHPGLLFPARVRNNASPCSVDQLSQELPSASPQVTLRFLAC